ncbi:hypothetical protein GCM10017772_24080 [Promicromonospora soli]|uniref:HTH araC/xylS-type domain-containing protein n=2 Tax=Promicromonospora soli TaxID=2035533 RepID=A0A919FVQ8_9MICO|nr:hypothetical protein GCM10017772_24080 [Promicromonospora soli]
MTALRREWLPAGATRSGAGALWALVLDGAATLETAGARRQVLPGDAVLVDPRTAHRLTADVETDIAHGDLRQVVPTAPLPSPLILPGFAAEHRGVVALVTTCPLKAKSSPDLFARSYAGLIGAAVTSLWQAAERLGDHPGHAGDAGDDPNGPPDAEVADVVAALAARPGESWTLDRMAGMVHLSRSALTERFRRATGHSPMRMLREVRMHRARLLLADEYLPVTRVAFDVGYGSVAAFSRAFAAEHGASPLAWRAAPSPVAPGPLDLATSRMETPPARGASGARYAHERPADTGGHRRARANHEQKADAVPVQ